MGKFTNDDVLDASINEIKNNATRICVCSAQPTTSKVISQIIETTGVLVEMSERTHVSTHIEVKAEYE